ncbi:predicted protein [Clavispora lusitaniae ATCC 42720]|uniref:Uncharacterized protein n=1 Tax=Clavispora lusitaniae (strain ATCC 42720) TaxID=306902 RepID=C4Y8B1_CLAL4|nr:uncharacterized protein CLUG_04439 [Clavispora lusitaniae ATCC 42720]EEQ40310.1 predicted protein [Clavispora lusitaniae ATCC 42720]
MVATTPFVTGRTSSTAPRWPGIAQVCARWARRSTTHTDPSAPPVKSVPSREHERAYTLSRATLMDAAGDSPAERKSNKWTARAAPAAATSCGATKTHRAVSCGDTSDRTRRPAPKSHVDTVVESAATASAPSEETSATGARETFPRGGPRVRRAPTPATIAPSAHCDSASHVSEEVFVRPSLVS